MVIQTFIWKLCSPLHTLHGVINPQVPLCGLCRFEVGRQGKMAILDAQRDDINNLGNTVSFLKGLVYSDPQFPVDEFVNVHIY